MIYYLQPVRAFPAYQNLKKCQITRVVLSIPEATVIVE